MKMRVFHITHFFFPFSLITKKNQTCKITEIFSYIICKKKSPRNRIKTRQVLPHIEKEVHLFYYPKAILLALGIEESPLGGFLFRLSFPQSCIQQHLKILLNLWLLIGLVGVPPRDPLRRFQFNTVFTE